MNNKYLIAIDIDGTLLNKNKKISFITKHYLRKLSKKGHIVVLASGRPFHSLERYYKELKLTGPVICYNGLLAFNPNDKDFKRFGDPYTKEEIKGLKELFFPEYSKNYMLQSEKGLYFDRFDKYLAYYFGKNDISIYENSNLDKIDEEIWTIIFDSNDKEQNKTILEKVKQFKNLSVRFWTNDHYYEVFKYGYDKSNALSYLMNYFNIDRNHVIAFGDADNDVSMFSVAGISVCMSNSKSKEALSKASLVSLKDNNHNGIYHSLKYIFKTNSK